VIKTQQILSKKSAILTSDKKISDPLIEEDLARLSHECKSLQEMVQKLEEANANLQADCLRKEDLLKSSSNPPEKATGEGGGEDVNISNDSSSSVSSHHPSQLQVGLEKEDDALQEVKERLVSVEAEKDKLEVDVSRLEEELSIIAVASRTLTACTVIPIIVLLIAIVMAFLPSISSILGTRDF